MREFRKTAVGKEWRWRIWIDRDDVHTETGFVGGTLQHLVNNATPKYKGSVCEVSASVSAATRATKLIREKMRSGFTEVDPETGEPLSGALQHSFDQWTDLPQTFRTFKKRLLNEPGRMETPDFLSMVEARQCLLYELPPGRLFTCIRCANGRSRIYSMRSEEYTDRMPHLASALDRSSIPPRSMFTAYVSTGRTKDDRSLFMSKDVAAMVSRQLAPGMRLEATVCDTFFWDGEDVISGRSWAKNKTLWSQLWDTIDIPYFSPLRQLDGDDLDEAKRWVEDNERPGVIVYDRLSVTERKRCYSLNASLPLPAVWVWRRTMTDEFYLLFHPSIGGRTGIIHKRTRTKGEAPAPDTTLRLGKVGLYQAGPAGEPLCYGTCRHGFDEATQAFIKEQATKHKGWVGRGRVRFIDYQEAAHSNVVSRLVDPYFLEFLPEDETLQAYRTRGVAPGLGTSQARELRESY